MKLGLKKKKKADQPKVLNAYYDIILSPVVTEKTTMIGEQNKVVFAVKQSADKAAIKAAVEALFSVKVAKVNTVIRKGKQKRFRGVEGRQSDVKKAVITLAEGQTIDAAAGVR